MRRNNRMANNREERQLTGFGFSTSRKRAGGKLRISGINTMSGMGKLEPKLGQQFKMKGNGKRGC